MTPLLVLVLLVVCGVNSEIQVKHLAGPPSEFKYFTPLNPAHFPEIQHSATFQVDLEPDYLQATNVLSQQVPLTVDSKNEFRFFWFSPYSEDIIVSLEDPLGNPVSLQALPTFVPIGDIHIPGTAYIIEDPIVGDYILSLRTGSLNQSLYNALTTNTNEDVYIVVWNEDELAMHTTLNTYDHITGNKVGLVTYIVDTSISDGRKAYKDGQVLNAEMSVTLPNGRVVEKEMYDDGLHADDESDDDVYGALITAHVPGIYIFSATINGTNAEGDYYVRTTKKVIQVIDDTISLTGSAIAYLDPSLTRLIINIGVHAHLGQKYYGYAEVWGVDGESDDHVPIAWIGGMAFVNDDPYTGGKALALELDLNWISMANAQGPLTLRNVVIKDPAVFVNVDEAERIHVKTTVSIESVMSKISLLGSTDQITQEMREGRLPITNFTVGTGGIVLVHGYCSGANPFQSNPSGTWTNARFYLNANKNMHNDAFAQSILNFAGTSTPYSCVGHSQGGMAIMHLKQFYVSGMDKVSGDGRVVQSVGTPYKGCSAAGTAANLGSLFGISCGANVDLTTDGAVKWLSTITPGNRAKAYFFTTTYEQGKALGDWCNLAMNSLLQWPNDGTTEHDKALLSNGNNMGNIQKWCHVDGMRYAAQCGDISRNTAMNANAAR